MHPSLSNTEPVGYLSEALMLYVCFGTLHVDGSKVFDDACSG